MSATWDPTLSSQRDHIRLRLGDTDAAGAMVADETIDALLATYSYAEALAQLADALAAQHAQRPAVVADNGQRFDWPERVSTWKEIARQARAGLIPEPGETSARSASAAVGQLTQAGAVVGRTSGFRAD